MPNTNTYHLYIHLDQLNEESAMADGSSNGNSPKKYEDKTAQSAQNAAKKFVSYSFAKSTADRLISGEISQVSLKTGAQEYEQRLSATYSIASQVIDAGVSLGIGIATGTWPLVLAGLAVSGINKAVSIMQKERKINMAQSLEDISINMQNIRAGTSGRRSSNQ